MHFGPRARVYNYYYYYWAVFFFHPFETNLFCYRKVRFDVLYFCTISFRAQPPYTNVGSLGCFAIGIRRGCNRTVYLLHRAFQQITIQLGYMFLGLVLADVDVLNTKLLSEITRVQKYN